jgi:hypothetical protein
MLQHLRSASIRSSRWTLLVGAVAAAAIVSSLAAGGARALGQGQSAQSEKKRAGAWTPPRTPWGHPDLQGTWTDATPTPLERPARLGNKETYTDEELAIVRQQPGEGAGVGYPEHWYSRGLALRRTSLIVDPPDGRIPPLTPEARKRQAALADARRQHGPADSWLDRSLHERCITRSNLPRLPAPYNNITQIFQTPSHIAISYELLHEARIIPLDGRPHLSSRVRLWLGDSRGHWEGDTLVVETTNFTEKTSFMGSSPYMRFVERFTRVAEDAVTNTFTVDDPEAFTASWTAALPLTKTRGPVYEYACHEGNYALRGILAGARAEERAPR